MTNNGRKTFTTIQGHRIRPVPASLGWYLVETAPGSQHFMFAHQPEALKIIEDHNRLWAASHGAAAVAREQKKHAALVERVRDANRRAGYTDAEIDAAWTARRPATPAQQSIF